MTLFLATLWNSLYYLMENNTLESTIHSIVTKTLPFIFALVEKKTIVQGEDWMSISDNRLRRQSLYHLTIFIFYSRRLHTFYYI